MRYQAKKSDTSQDKYFRYSKEEVIDLIFAAFQNTAYLDFKSLLNYTKQPQVCTTTKQGN